MRTVHETIKIPEVMEKIHNSFMQMMYDAKLTYSEGIAICESVKSELSYQWLKEKSKKK